MQQRFAGQLGGGTEVETKDIKDILMGTIENWADNLGALQAVISGTR
jgi:hypothetical protein